MNSCPTAPPGPAHYYATLILFASPGDAHQGGDREAAWIARSAVWRAARRACATCRVDPECIPSVIWEACMVALRSFDWTKYPPLETTRWSGWCSRWAVYVAADLVRPFAVEGEPEDLAEPAACDRYAVACDRAVAALHKRLSEPPRSERRAQRLRVICERLKGHTLREVGASMGLHHTTVGDLEREAIGMLADEFKGSWETFVGVA